MMRALAVIGVGFLTGLLFGSLGVFTLVAAWVGIDHARAYDRTALLPYWSEVWEALADPTSLPYLAAFVAYAAANGAIGGWAGRRWGRRRVAPTLLLPLLLLGFPLVTLLRGQPESKPADAELVVFGVMGVFVWVAGRVGQELGAALAVGPTASRRTGSGRPGSCASGG